MCQQLLSFVRYFLGRAGGWLEGDGGLGRARGSSLTIDSSPSIAIAIAQPNPSSSLYTPLSSMSPSIAYLLLQSKPVGLITE